MLDLLTIKHLSLTKSIQQVLAIFCLFLFSMNGNSTIPVMELDETANGIDISQYSEYICIDENLTTISQIEQLTFSPWKGGLINFGYTTQYCWIRFQVSNNTDRLQNYYLSSRLNFVDHNDVIFKQNGKENFIALGNQPPLKERAYSTSAGIGLISLAAHENLTIYVKGYTHNTLVIPISIYAEKPFIELISLSLWFDGVFYGSFIGLLVLSFLLFWYFRDFTYVSYFASVIFMSALLLNMEGKTIYLWPNRPQLTLYFHMFFTYMTISSSVIFTKYYLNIFDHKWLNRFSNFNIAICIIFIFLIPIISVRYNNMATSFSAIIGAIFLLFTGVVQLKNGMKEAIYYCIGWGVLLMSVLLISSSIFGNSLPMDIMMTVIKFAFLLQQIILGLGLSSRIKTLQMKEEKSREIAFSNQMKLDTRNEFFAKMSHEIRTPINGVLGCLQLIETKKMDQLQSDYINTAKNSANLLLCIVNDILDLSKIEAGKLSLEEKTFNLRKQIYECTQIFTFQISDKNIELLTNIDSNIPELITTDALRLQQVILNLISNAIKFTEQGTISLNVKLVEKTLGNYRIEFSVSDTGIGMAQEDINDLFKPFHQTIHTGTTHYGGTGLGLSICKEICEMLHGSIYAHSTLGKGSTFTFNILTSEPTKQPLIQLTKSSPNYKDNENPLKGLNILFAEDNITNEKVLAGILKKLQINFTSVKNGALAFEAFSYSPHFDVILMDCEMPEMNGFEATKIIRRFEQEHNLKSTPIIALTAHATPKIAEQCLLAGMNSHMPKPINIELLGLEIIKVLKN